MQRPMPIVVAMSLVWGMGACAATKAAPASSPAASSVSHAHSGLCQGFGPQTPRDIDQRAGTNQRVFSIAPPAEQMNLCNIHFHKNAEHKAAAFSVPAADGAAGFQCQMAGSLTPAELTAPAVNHCKGIQPGDTIELHWVHSSCDVVPGPGLGSCLSDACANPNLRVETQVFTVVNDPNALNFADFAEAGGKVAGYYQPKAIPSSTGAPVTFLGSTTGPKYSEQVCSPLQVTWSVRPQCAKVHVGSLSAWCKDNAFNEDHGHGVRPLVTAPALLSPIR